MAGLSPLPDVATKTLSKPRTWTDYDVDDQWRVPGLRTGPGLLKSVGRARGVWGGNCRRRKVDLNRFRIATANVDSLNGRSAKIIEMLTRRRVDVCAVAEIGAGGDSIGMVEGKNSRYKLFRKGELVGKSKVEGKGGIGILVAEKWVKCVTKIDRDPDCDRIMSVSLHIEGKDIIIFCVYAPHCGLRGEIKDKFYECLRYKTSQVADEVMLFIAGDLNGHVGRQAPKEYEGVHGGFSFGKEPNPEGERLLEFCASMDLFISNTCFKKRDRRLITYKKGDHESQIDFILGRKRDRSRFKDVRAVANEPCIPSHKLLVGDIALEQDRKASGNGKKTPKLKIWKLRDPNVQEEYRKSVDGLVAKKKCANSQDNVEIDKVEATWSILKESLLEAADSTLGWAKGSRKHDFKYWWDGTVDRAVSERRELYEKWNKGECSREVYDRAESNVRREIVKAKERSEVEIRDECHKDRNYVFRLAKQISGEGKVVMGEPCVLNDKGHLAKTMEDKLQAWREHYNRLLNVEFSWDSEHLIESPPKEGPPVWIVREWVVKALGKMKKGKAAGPSGVVVEMLRAAGDAAVDLLHSLANEIVKAGRMPSDWGVSTIINCYKGKGDSKERGNYRGLKLLDQCMKVFERIVEGLVRDQVDIDEMQYGFRQGRGTTDAIFIVRQLQEKYLNKQKRIYFAFIDLEKAFDRVPRKVLWWAMRTLGVEDWLIRVVQVMYQDVKSKVRVEGSYSEEFPVEVGVHQGSILSPLLFIIVMEAISRNSRLGCPWELLYADDIVLIATDIEELERQIRAWNDNLGNKGLRVNMNKTKVMVSGRDMGTLIEEGKYPCAMCKTGVGSRNAVQCVRCKYWVHGRWKCSGLRRITKSSGENYVCGKCRGAAKPLKVDSGLRVSVDGTELEMVDRFCYLGDTISSGGGATASVVARIGVGWRKFRELKPILTSRAFSHLTKGVVYSTSVRSAMIYGSQTWALKADDVARLERTENAMLRWMCGVKIRDRVNSNTLRDRLEIKNIKEVVGRSRLSWLGHVLRMEENRGVSRTYNMIVEGENPKGRPPTTWNAVVERDMKDRGLNRDMAQNRVAWRGRVSRGVINL